MTYTDLDIARRHCQDIRELIERHCAGATDYPALQKLQRCCRGASSALNDRECRERAGAVEDYACELFAGAADFRRELLEELDALVARIAAIESLRHAVAQHRAA
jgi:hypothetical protein